MSKIESIKTKLNNIDIKIDNYNCEDLVLIFDLQSSLLSAESTILSALHRNESRGAHQRSDFPKVDKSCQFNCLVSMDKNNNLKISRSPLKELNETLKTVIANAKKQEDIKDKFLE